MSNVRVKAQGTARSGLAFLLAIIMVMSLMSPRFSWANNADGPSNSAITPPIVSDAGIESEEDSDESISDIDSDDVASDAGIESEIDNPNVSDSSIAQDADTSSETTRSGLSVQGDTEALEITGELENDSILYRSRFIGYDHANKGQSSLIYHPSVMKSISGGEAFFAQDQDPVIYFTDGNRAVYCFEPENGLITPNPAIGDSTNKLTFVQKEMLAYILANGQNEYAGYFNNNMDPKPANGYGEAVENANAPALQRQIATQLATWLVGSNHYKSDDVVRKAVIPAGTGGTGAGFAPTPYIAQIAGELLDKAYAALTSSPKLEPSVSVMTPSGTSYTVDLTDENKAISTSLDRSLWQTAILNALKAKGLSGSFNGNILTITGDPGVGTEAYGGTTINATIPASNYSKALLAYFSGNSSSFQGM
ncbi:MAG: MSCRAMM family adhesin SdrC, partial [Clostridiales Family XIII bacterium]|nr:MSCRAMM family adhesin SdrC [Clostridiales Family XIII bacterium]